jgi:hypothetical protein
VMRYGLAGSTDWGALVSAAASGDGSAPPTWQNALADQALVQAAQWSASKPVVQVNRARTAALAHQGYQYMDTLESWRPAIFAAAASMSIISGTLTYRRRKVPEAWMLYGTLSLLSGAVAWFTRPGFLRPSPAPMPSEATSPSPGDPSPPAPGVLAEFLGWLDRKVASFEQENPRWQSQTWTRLARDTGFGTIKQPYVKALLLPS